MASTIFEFLKENEAVINVMLKNGIDPVELRNVEIYDEYLRMKEAKHKTLYIVSYLADKNHLNVRQIYRIVKKMGKEL